MNRQEEYAKRIAELKVNLLQVQSDIKDSKSDLVVAELKGAEVVLKEHLKIMEDSYADYRKRSGLEINKEEIALEALLVGRAKVKAGIVEEKKPKKEGKKDEQERKGSKAKGKLSNKKKK